MRYRLARLLRLAANRLEPAPPLTYEARMPMTEASAKGIAAGFTKTVGPRC